jgi:hypothetical protein
MSSRRKGNVRTQCPGEPEILGYVERVGPEDAISIGNRTVGISVNARKDGFTEAVLDIREFSKNTNIAVKVELSELVAAISMASVNRSTE